MMILLVLALFFIHHQAVSSPLMITNSSSLQYYLCESGSLQSGTELILLNEIEHILSTGPFCLVSNLENITIRSSLYNKLASIKCKPHYKQGLGFYNITNLTLQNIRMQHCGGYLPKYLFSFLANESFYFESNQSVSVVLSNCSKVSLFNVTVLDYCGFGVILLNPTGFIFLEHINVSMAETVAMYHKCIGTGIVLYYSNRYNYFWSHFVLRHALFIENYNYLKLKRSIAKLLQSNYSPKFPVSSLSACFTVIYTHGIYSANVSLKYGSFYRCVGGYFGGLATVFYNVTSNLTSFSIDSYNFQHNILNIFPDSGFGIYIKDVNTSISYTCIWNSVIITNCNFFDHQSNKLIHHADKNSLEKSSLFILTDDTASAISIKSVLYERWYFGYRNPFIYAISSSANVKKLKIYFCQIEYLTKKGYHKLSGGAGTLIFKNIESVYIEGNNNKFMQITGSAITAYNSDIHLKGMTIFNDIMADYGAAIHLEDSSHIFIYDSTNVIFKNNSATFFGGAISSDVFVNPFTKDSYCAIQLGQNIDLAQTKSLLHFEDNDALLAGNSMYISNMYQCTQKHRVTAASDLIQLYNNIFNFKISKHKINGLAQVSSLPYKVCLCLSNNRVICMGQSFSLYAGEPLMINLIVFDLNNTQTYSAINAELVSGDKNVSDVQDISWRLKLNNQPLPVVSGVGCTKLKYNINLHNLALTSLRMLIYVSSISPRLEIHIKKLDCPIGFIENITCVCSPFLVSLGITECNINDTSVTIALHSWLGTVNYSNKSVLGYSNQCPAGYCKTLLTKVNILQTDYVCTGNHHGMLCGQCKEGYSVVIGSEECHICSNTSLYVIAIYIVGGALYVLFLYVLRWTIDSGTVGGLVFWLDIVSIINVPLPLKTYNNIVKYVFCITHLLSFQWTMPACLFDGLTALHRHAFLFAIPVYLWFLVAVIVLISRCSSTIANITVNSSVQVLATLMHLSVSKLFLTSITTVIPTQIYIDSGNTSSTYSSMWVWYTDGSVLYGKNVYHIALIIISSLTLCLFIFPYIAIGLLGEKYVYRCICSQYLRPFVESLCAPYKEKTGYWFGVRLVVLTLMYSIHIFFQGKNFNIQLLLFTVILGTFIIAQACLMPFKNKFLNALDLWFMILLEGNFIVYMYCITRKDVLFESVSSLLIQLMGLSSCIAVLIYHISLKLKRQTEMFRQFVKNMKCVRKLHYIYTLLKNEDQSQPQLIVNGDHDDNDVEDSNNNHVTRSEVWLYSLIDEQD